MRSRNAWLAEVRRLLEDALPAAVVCSEPQAERGQHDLDFRLRDGAHVAVEVKVVRAPRIAEVEGQLARSVLELRRHGGGPGDVPVAVVALSSFGPRLEQSIRTFMAEYAPHVGWALLDQRGKAVLAIPALDVAWSRAPAFERSAAVPSDGRDRQLFTDLNRWMLKVLLLREAPESQWGGPRAKPKHPTELAKIACVSVRKAHQFASAFREEGYMSKSGSELRLVRVAALLEAWLQDEKNCSPKVIPARSMVPGRLAQDSEVSNLSDLPVPSEAWPDVAVGGASAALHGGLSHVGGRQLPLLHVAISMSRALHDWHLEGCDRRDASLLLNQPMYRQSVFRGVVKRPRGAPLVDLWQIALDAVSSPARGREQAEFIVQRVLALQGEA